MSAKPLQVMLAAGGTGGHMFPAQSLAKELLARGHDVVLVTDRRGAGFGPELPQVETHRISAGGIAGRGLVGKLRSAAHLALGYLQARRLVSSFEPDTVVGFGGYPSVPTVLAAAHAGRRIVLHEQNAVLGRANRLLASRASAIATCFTKVSGIAPSDAGKATLTGNPVRPAIIDLARRPYAVPGPTDRLNILVTGGSQGASVFNDIVPAAISRLPEALCLRLSIAQQVRGEGRETIEGIYRNRDVESSLAPFFEDLPERLATAHLVICRSGASTVAELGAAGRPAIMVPYPSATDDHQTANAEALAAAGGGWLMVQDALSAKSLGERLEQLLSNPSRLATAAHCAAAFAIADATQRLADLVCRTQANGNGEELRDNKRQQGVAA